MSNKVKLTQEQHYAIQNYLGEYKKSNLIMFVATQELQSENPLYDIPFDDLIAAVYRPEDVVIEQTVEEKLIEQHDNPNQYTESHWSIQDAFSNGIYTALDIIGMKVKGINA